MICFHHNDADGYCSAFLVDEYYTSDMNKKFVEMNYGKKFPLDLVEKDEDVFIVDFSIEPEDMKALLKVTKNVTWIDHHVSAIRKYNNFRQKINGIRLDGTAASMLTYVYMSCFYTSSPQQYDDAHDLEPFVKSMSQFAPDFVKYVADYDVWRFEYGDDTRFFLKGCESRDITKMTFWKLLYTEAGEVKKVIEEGKTIQKYRANLMNSIIKDSAFITEFPTVAYGDVKALCLNCPRISTDDFADCDKADAQIIIGYHYDGTAQKWAYALRQIDPEIDCSKIAESFGGGGHVGAAGFASEGLLIYHR